MDRVRSLRNIPKRLRGTNFCTSLARFPPSFLRQPNGPKCTQMVQISPKHEFRVQWGGSSAFVAKNSNATSWQKFWSNGVGIFRNERTRSTPFGPKLMFWCISYHLSASSTVWLPQETRWKTGWTSAKVRATKSGRNFSQQITRSIPLNSKTSV